MAVCSLLISSVCMLSPPPPPPLSWLLPLLSLILPVLLPVLLRCWMSGFLCPIPRSRDGKGDSSGSSCSTKTRFYRRTASQNHCRPHHHHHHRSQPFRQASSQLMPCHNTKGQQNGLGCGGGGIITGGKLKRRVVVFIQGCCSAVAGCRENPRLRNTPETLLPVQGTANNLSTSSNTSRRGVLIKHPLVIRSIHQRYIWYVNRWFRERQTDRLINVSRGNSDRGGINKPRWGRQEKMTVLL